MAFGLAVGVGIAAAFIPSGGTSKATREQPAGDPAGQVPQGHPGADHPGAAPGADHGAAAPGQGKVVGGKVLEVIQVPEKGYTYARIDRGNGDEAWVAVPTSEIKVGTQIRVADAMEMHDFPSDALKRKFKLLYLGTLSTGLPSAAPPAGHGMGSQPPSGHGMAAGEAADQPAPPTVKAGDVKPATGADAHTVSQIFKNAAALSGKQVRLRAVVTKRTDGILDRNFLHVRDGTGSDEGKDNDLVVTTKDTPTVGQTVLIEGTVSTNKDFGAGYTYAVIVEKAAIKP